MSITKNTVLAALCATSLVACIKQDSAPDELKNAIPLAEQVQIKLPGGAERTVGQLAEWYVATRGVTRMFNGGA